MWQNTTKWYHNQKNETKFVTNCSNAIIANFNVHFHSRAIYTATHHQQLTHTDTNWHAHIDINTHRRYVTPKYIDIIVHNNWWLHSLALKVRESHIGTHTSSEKATQNNWLHRLYIFIVNRTPSWIFVKFCRTLCNFATEWVVQVKTFQFSIVFFSHV